MSKPFAYKRGVKQGCPTPPLVFNIYIDDLLETMTGLCVPGGVMVKGLGFADGTVLLGDSRGTLQDNLLKLEKWCRDNAMEINVSKCGTMVDTESPYDLCMLDRAEVPAVDKYIYLGMKITPDMNLMTMAKYRLGIGYETLG